MHTKYLGWKSNNISLQRLKTIAFSTGNSSILRQKSSRCCNTDATFHSCQQLTVRYGNLMVYLSQAALSNEGILNEHPLSSEVPCFKPLAHYSNKVFSTAEELKQTQQFFEAR